MTNFRSLYAKRFISAPPPSDGDGGWSVWFSSQVQLVMAMVMVMVMVVVVVMVMVTVGYGRLVGWIE